MRTQEDVILEDDFICIRLKNESEYSAALSQKI